MKLKVLRETVEAKFAEAIKLAQQKADFENALILCRICEENDIEVLDKRNGMMHKLVSREASYKQFGYEIHVEMYTFLHKKYYNSIYEEDAIRFILSHKEDILEIFERKCSRLGVSYRIQFVDVETITKEEIRKAIVNENKNHWLKPEPARHVRNKSNCARGQHMETRKGKIVEIKHRKVNPQSFHYYKKDIVLSRRAVDKKRMEICELVLCFDFDEDQR